MTNAICGMAARRTSLVQPSQKSTRVGKLQRGHCGELGIATADQSRDKKTKGTNQDYAGHSKAAPNFVTGKSDDRRKHQIGQQKSENDIVPDLVSREVADGRVQHREHKQQERHSCGNSGNRRYHVHSTLENAPVDVGIILGLARLHSIQLDELHQQTGLSRSAEQ